MDKRIKYYLDAPLRFTYGKNFYPWEKLTVRYFQIPTDKIKKPVRLALISDLHRTCYGKDQSELIAAVKHGRPDAILFPGDIMENGCPHSKTDLLLDALSRRYPCYYATGNHEFYAGKADTVKDHIASFGIIVLDGRYTEASLNGQRIRICGTDDPQTGKRQWQKQLLHAAEAVDGTAFTVLLAHQPSLLEIYSRFGFDLVVSGHAHGGQLRIPPFQRGMFAPGQGFFPEYAGGEYHQKDTTMIVGHGLAKNIFPRFGNPPEIVFIRLVPKSGRLKKKQP